MLINAQRIQRRVYGWVEAHVGASYIAMAVLQMLLAYCHVNRGLTGKLISFVFAPLGAWSEIASSIRPESLIMPTVRSFTAVTYLVALVSLVGFRLLRWQSPVMRTLALTIVTPILLAAAVMLFRLSTTETWAGLAAFAGFMAMWCIGGFRALYYFSPARPKQPALCCGQCGYNLTGNVSGVCPECGTAIVGERV